MLEDREIAHLAAMVPSTKEKSESDTNSIPNAMFTISRGGLGGDSEHHVVFSSHTTVKDLPFHPFPIKY